MGYTALLEIYKMMRKALIFPKLGKKHHRGFDYRIEEIHYVWYSTKTKVQNSSANIKRAIILHLRRISEIADPQQTGILAIP